MRCTTLKSKYNRVVEKITVTPEMSERIMEKIAAQDFRGHGTARKTAVPWRKVWSLAACFLALLGGAALLGHLLKPPTPALPGITEYGSLAELAAHMDFELLTPGLPEMRETSFKSFFAAMAEIKYSDGSNTITYRMARGKDDISGDYTSYPDIKEYQGSDRIVTLKGQGGGAYVLATWTRGGFTFSLSSESPLPQDDLLPIVLSVP
jgi:hypothetical protein